MHIHALPTFPKLRLGLRRSEGKRIGFARGDRGYVVGVFLGAYGVFWPLRTVHIYHEHMSLFSLFSFFLLQKAFLKD